jgi:cytochrome c-type biogenesis protein CcsB
VKKYIDMFISFKISLLLLIVLALGATFGTFIENDYGVSTARILVYNSIWYEFVMVLTAINLLGMIYKFKMYKKPAKFLIHIAFIVILIGASITRYFGYEGIMHIKEGEKQNKMVSLEPYLQISILDNNQSHKKNFQLNLSALSNEFHYEMAVDDKIFNIDYINYNYVKKNKSSMGILDINISLGDKYEVVRLVGKRGIKSGVVKKININDSIISAEYGSKELYLPFSIYLKDFKLDRYPGSGSPSSYASEVRVYPNDKEPYDYRIYMNQTMHEGGFLFFQSSYDPDEKGTVLSVNHDPGKWPTYFGYFLLILGLLTNLFSKKSRFSKLVKVLKTQNSILAIPLLLLFLNSNIIAKTEFANLQDIDSKTIVNYINSYKEASKETAEIFSKLVVQNRNGRMVTMHTLNRDILRKLSGKTSLFGMNANQIILGMLTNSPVWQHIKMIKVKTNRLKSELNISNSENYIAFADVFMGKSYLLDNFIKEAYNSKPSQRGTFDKDVIKVDERLNIAYLTYISEMFKIFPKVGDNSNKWYTPIEAIKSFEGKNKIAIEAITRRFLNAVSDNNWEQANIFLSLISTYQSRIGSEIMLSKEEIKREIWFDDVDIFPKLTIAYLIVGLLTLVFAFIALFNQKINSTLYTRIFFAITIILFSIHTFGMGFRWVISGHAPWSNTYESLLYIAWSGVFAGLVLFRKSLFALSSAIVIASIFMFTAHLSHIDPEITNLVPVLKSYWLTIHVSVLTLSYGFFGLSAVIGFLTLILFIVKGDKSYINDNIKNLATINEISLIVGLSAITIGNFLGGIWANESWGRYWGWDPKETWAYISIIVYAIVIHLRFIKSLNNPFALSVASVLAFSSILMTYFGVNFYLSGLHSYATGDPLPIPTWVYVVVALVFFTILFAYKKREIK